MDANAKVAAGREREYGSIPPMSDCVSLGSYLEYPSRRPFINTHTHRPVTHSNTHRAHRAFPESSSAAIISALQNLQEKIRNLELQRADAQHKQKSNGGGNTRSLHQHDSLSPAEPGRSCSELQSNQLKNSLLDRNTQTRSSVEQKVSALEHDYQHLCETLRSSQRKIRRLESKLQEEEAQRRLLQDKAQQLQTGLEANRLLIQSVSPPPQKSKHKKLTVKKLSSLSQPHYRLSLGDVPFVTGTSTASSHSVRANVQRVLHLLKHHHPQFCNEQVLGHTSSSSSTSSADELSELLLMLQDEFGTLSFEQQDLSRQIRTCVSDRLRQDLEREMEALLKKMEQKGEQIDKMQKLKKARSKQNGTGSKMEVTKTVVKARAGDRSRESLKLLRDLRSLQNTLDEQL
ncbi:hypothetical protein DNTS_009488 [Danionella cerebrum]|uniref:Centrosomal protein of 57 kDa n=1 Tax=Danionella cerebrum TaxID=2873325 RepID=A0A553QST3_9TELE|nr:hypothetical protein DNTS_009488 [Danionella translucida]